MTNIINNFRGTPLSNFAPAKVILDSIPYNTVEHAYQAAKSLRVEDRNKIRVCPTPSTAKRIGRTFKLRENWNEIRLEIMEDLLNQKFMVDGFNRNYLIKTGDSELIESNTWGDTFWGVCAGNGHNHLGKLLMKIRDKINNKSMESNN